MSDEPDEPFGITETQIASADPQLTLNVINSWPQAAQRMAEHGDAYEGAVRAPEWEGQTAGVITATASRHNTQIADDKDTINALHRRATAAMDNVIKSRRAVLNLIDDTRKGNQFTVSDDLRVSAAKLQEQAAANSKETQIRQAAQKWADAETFAASEIRAGAQSLTGRGNRGRVQLVDHNVPLKPPGDWYPTNEVIREATDLDGNHVVLRRGYYDGKRGFGFDKMFWRHGITNPEVFVDLISHSRPIRNKDNELIYEVPIVRTHCSTGIFGGCQDTNERLTMRIVVDTATGRAGVPDGGQKGVITMYPIAGGSGVTEPQPDVTVAPNWVNTNVPIN